MRKIFVLFGLFVAMPVHADQFWQRLHWLTHDGVSMVGNYHPPSRAGAATWVLLHGLGSVKEEWESFSKELAKQGNGIFIYDARGHGESHLNKSGEKVAYQEWQNAGPGTPWDFMSKDLGGAIEALKKQPGTSSRKIAVGGASLGANVALTYASATPEVAALLLLSPGLDYAGVQSPKPYVAYKGRPVLIAASPSDSYAYATVQQLTQLASSDQQIVVEGNSGHGVQMLDPTFKKQLLDWMKRIDGNRNRRPS